MPVPFSNEKNVLEDTGVFCVQDFGFSYSVAGARLTFDLQPVRRTFWISQTIYLLQEHTEELLLLKDQYHYLPKWKVRHPRTPQKFLTLTLGCVSDTEIKLLGILITKLANTVFNFKYFSPKVALTRAN